ncbi:MAG: ATP-binding protein [Desulfobacteraceae bacterium]|nr:ATP-binding protein [Desulfobacteraceae bacterium]
MNLFVGISAVGKTKILQALSLVRNVAIDDDYRLDGIEWMIRFVHDEKEYEWILKSRVIEDESAQKTFGTFQLSKDARIIYEKLTDLTDETVIFERNQDTLEWHDSKVIPKLKKTESIITIFSEEEVIMPIREAFNYLIFLNKDKYSSISVSDRFEIDSTVQDENRTPLNLKEFKKISAKMPMPLKTFFLQEFYQKEFEDIKQEFTDVFPSVKELKIDHIRKESEYIIRKESEYIFFLSIKEHDSNDWIHQTEMSSGMFSTFSQLIEIYLAPDGAVILIDEFENSLGMNCMPSASDLLNEYSAKLQFIVTSHHPYIINEISWKNWKIVKRKGGSVRIINSADIPELETASTLEKYVRLINLPAYEEGIE